MAFLVIHLLHHFILCVPLSLFCISILYLFCTFLIFCLLHFPQLIVYDDTLKVKYFVWDIFELNWNSYLPILFPSAFQLVFLSCVAFEREGWLKSLSSVHHSFANHVLLFLETSDAPNMKTEVLINWRIIGKDHPQQTPSCPVVIIIIIIAPEKFMLFNFLFSCLLYLG